MHPFPIQTRRIQTRQQSEIIEITDEIQEVVSAERLQDGMVIVFVPHTTAAVTINENADPDVKSDLIQKLASLIPRREAYYRHGEGNSDSHLKTSLTGNSATVLVERGKLVLGTWQGVQFCEFDGPRQRSYLIKLIGFDRSSTE